MYKEENYLSSNDDEDQSWEVMPILREIGEDLTLMKRMVNIIGASSDTTEERRKFLVFRTDLKDKLDQAISIISKMSYTKPEIENELGHYVKQFRSLLQTASFRFSNSKPNKIQSRDNDSESMPLLSKSSTETIDFSSNMLSMKELQELETEMSVNNSQSQDETKMLEEHMKKVQTVQEELSGLKDLFKELDEVVASHEPELNMLTDEVIHIKNDTNIGMEYLNKTSTYPNTARRNRYLLLLFLIIVSVVMGAFLWTANNRHHGKSR